MSMPMEFAFGDNPVRVVLVNGDPWWLTADIAVALEDRDANDMTRNLDEDEKGTQIVSTLGGDQEVLVINESGLYSAILRSRKASAKRFKMWVTAKVLPSIRKHGSYVMPPAADEQEPTSMAAHIEADQVVSAGRVPVTPGWGMRRELLSPRYATDWNGLWRVRCE